MLGGNKMSLDETISMEGVKEKLRNLQDYMPDQAEAIYVFGRYLADRLNQELSPSGFYLANIFVIYDLKRGIDGDTERPINNTLVGGQPELYASLGELIPAIAEAVCPEDFANGVRENYNRLKSKMRE